MDISTFWPRTGFGWHGAGGREAFWLFRHTQMKKNSRAIASGIATLGTRMYMIPILLLPCLGKSVDSQYTNIWTKTYEKSVITTFSHKLRQCQLKYVFWCKIFHRLPKFGYIQNRIQAYCILKIYCTRQTNFLNGILFNHALGPYYIPIYQLFKLILCKLILTFCSPIK